MARGTLVAVRGIAKARETTNRTSAALRPIYSNHVFAKKAAVVLRPQTLHFGRYREHSRHHLSMCVSRFARAIPFGADPFNLIAAHTAAVVDPAGGFAGSALVVGAPES